MRNLKDEIIKAILAVGDKYSLTVGESISIVIPHKCSLASATDSDLFLWLNYYLINGRRIEL